MNVCFVTYEYPPNIFGGAGTYAELLVKGLKKLNVNLHLITHGPKNVYQENYTQLNTPDITKWRRLYFSYYIQKTIKKLNEKKHFDLIHYNEPHILLSTPKIPIVSTFHSTQINEFRVNLHPSMRKNINFFESLPKNIVGSIGDVLSAQKSNIIITPCTDLKNNIKKYCLKNESSLKVILNGIALSSNNENYDQNRILDKYNLTPNKYILFIGRLDPIKGIESIINSFNQISIKNTELQLAIIGKGTQENYLKQISKKNSKIKFLGHISNNEEKTTLYKNTLCLVLPSFYEAIPMVILEAMAEGRPIIASKIGGIPDIVQHQINGFLIKPGDPDAITASINILLNNPNLWKKISETNLNTAKTKFGYQEMAKKVLMVYEELLYSDKLKNNPPP